MLQFRPRTRRFQGIAIALLLVLGQNAAAFHPAQHDDGLLRSSTCAACVTAHLLSSACVDTAIVPDPVPQHADETPTPQSLPASIERLTPRQRAPPLTP